MPQIPHDPNVAQRKVYFHKAVAPVEGDDFELDAEHLVGLIERLLGTDRFHFDEGDDQYLCAVVDQDAPPQRVRFYRVRRRNLPETEEAGAFEELDLDPERGLAESIHVVLFEDNVVGSEYNHYGPRISLLPTFLREQCGYEFRLRQLVRSDVIEAILRMDEIRVLRLKVEPESAAVLQQQAGGLGGAFEAAELFSAGKYMDLTLAADRDRDGFTSKVKQLFRALRDQPQPIETLLDAGQVHGRTAGGELSSLDVLHERVVLSQAIRRESPRHRTLDKDAAYAAIEAAHRQVRGELAAGTMIPEL